MSKITKFNVFDIAFLEDDTIESFTSDFREIARFFKKKRLGENPLASQIELAKIELLSEMDYSIPDIAERLNISEEQVRKVLQK